MFTLFYAMNHPTYNYHHQNPYYRPTAEGLGYVFANAVLDSYEFLNAHYWLPETSAVIRIGTVAARIANEEAEYERQLVRLSPPVIPSHGPPAGLTLCQVFANEPPSEVTPWGGIQYKIPLRYID